MEINHKPENIEASKTLKEAAELLKNNQIQKYWDFVSQNDPIVADLLARYASSELLTDELIDKMARLDISIRTNQVADGGPFELSQADVSAILAAIDLKEENKDGPNQEAFIGEDATDKLSAQDHEKISDIINQVGTPSDEIAEILAKGAENWTEEEMKTLMRHNSYNNTSHPLNKSAREGVSNWFDHHYGKEPAQQDFSGRTVTPEFVNAPNHETVDLKDPMGFAINHGARNVARQVATLAQVSGLPNAVQHLQLGINGLNRLKMLQANENNETTENIEDLLLDGDFGPKTKTLLRDALRKYGAETVENALALAQIGSFAEYTKQSGDAEHLEAIAHLALDQLFDLQPGEVAQHNKLNQIIQFVISSHAGHAGQPAADQDKLALDGIIGPKTKAAFIKTMQNSDGFEFAKHLGESLGLRA